MFYAKDGGGADRVTVMDGSLSPQGKHRKRPVVMKAELYGETTQNDRVVAPSLKQQRESLEWQAEQYRLQREAELLNTQTLEQLERESSYRSLEDEMQNFKAIAVNMQQDVEDVAQRSRDNYKNAQNTMPLQEEIQNVKRLASDSTEIIVNVSQNTMMGVGSVKSQDDVMVNDQEPKNEKAIVVTNQDDRADQQVVSTAGGKDE